MNHQVCTSPDASSDLEELDRYLSQNDSPSRAEYVLDRLGSAIASLNRNPQRGSYPPEMIELGVYEFREFFFKPYRIIYQIEKNNVFVLLIADGRRDMNTLLEKRLLQGETI
jgi:toxin ParE1/3/4